MSRGRKTQVKANGQHHWLEKLSWTVGIVGTLAGGAWAVFVYMHPEPSPSPQPAPPSPGPLIFKAPPINAPTFTIDNFPVGGWDVSVSNPNPSMMRIASALLISPEGGFPTFMTTHDLAPLRVTPLRITAFDESPQGSANLDSAKKKLMFMDYETTKCVLELTVQGIDGKRHMPRQEFKCGQIIYMKNPPRPPK